MRRRTIVDRHTLKHGNLNKKLVHMIRFIELEGYDKAEEIECKTEEECYILKGNLLQQGRNEILKKYAHKEFLCKLHTQISEGQLAYKAQLLVISRKMALLEDMEKEIKIILFQDLSCPRKRWSVIRNLIVESLFKLLEREVIIKCKDSDKEMIEKSKCEIQFVYKECTGKNVKISIDSTFLPNYMLPGVIVRTPNNKISVNNTLDARVKQVILNCLPVISHILFGTNKMRS